MKLVLLILVVGFIISYASIYQYKSHYEKEPTLKKVGSVVINNSKSIIDLWELNTPRSTCMVMVNIRDVSDPMITYSQISCD